jgi:hypothetical protein
MTEIQQPFEGFFEITKKLSTKFIETEEELDSFTIWFYRRETEKYTLEEFLDDLQPNTFGWDNVTQQLFFKSKENENYSVNFTKL